MSAEASTPLTRAAWDALHQVLDPELGLNVVDLGLVRSLKDEGGALVLDYKLTSATCPVGDVIARGMRDALSGLEGCLGVQADLLDEPWSPDDMTAAGRRALNL